jgi:hypothetical protein
MPSEIAGGAVTLRVPWVAWPGGARGWFPRLAGGGGGSPVPGHGGVLAIWVDRRSEVLDGAIGTISIYIVL